MTKSMTFTFILCFALIGSVSAPEASTLPSYTSDLGSHGPTMGQRDQDHNPSHGLMTYGLSHGLMTYGHDPGSLPVDTLTTPNHSGNAQGDQSGAHSLGYSVLGLPSQYLSSPQLLSSTGTETGLQTYFRLIYIHLSFRSHFLSNIIAISDETVYQRTVAHSHFNH